MRGIIIAVTIVLVVAIVMYGIVQIKRGKIDTPSQIDVKGPYTEDEAETFTPVEESTETTSED